MKAFRKEFFPVHLDPIQRDLIIIMMVGLLVAATFISVGFAVFH
jgi:hypothetical protein